MNPFESANLLDPRRQRDHREHSRNSAGADMDQTISRAAYRFIRGAGRMLGR